MWLAPMTIITIKTMHVTERQEGLGIVLSLVPLILPRFVEWKWITAFQLALFKSRCLISHDGAGWRFAASQSIWAVLNHFSRAVNPAHHYHYLPVSSSLAHEHHTFYGGPTAVASRSHNPQALHQQPSSPSLGYETAELPSRLSWGMMQCFCGMLQLFQVLFNPKNTKIDATLV